MTSTARFDERRGAPRARSPRRVGERALVSGLLGLVLLALAGRVGGQAPPPDLPWFTFETPRFHVVYPEGLESLARRAAGRAEGAMDALSGFGSAPSSRIQLVVTDHTDLSNGFAQVVHYPRIVIWARPPSDGPHAIPFDDWLDLVISHEVVHILHLEMTGRLGRIARAVFGRVSAPWPFFPSTTLSAWSVEGAAVQAESALTDAGRIHGTRLAATVRAAALEGALERIDQVRGRTPVWPGGDRPYIYGGLFFEHLVDRFGEEAVARYLRVIAERLNPYRLDASARDVFGLTLAELHREWRAEVERETVRLRDEVRRRALAPEPERLTRDARMAIHPVFHPDDGTLAFVRGDGRSEAGLFVLGDGERRLARLNLLAPPAWAPDGDIWVPQPEFVGRYEIRSELWRISPEGEHTRVGRGLRVAAVDARRADGALAAVLETPGTNRLVLLSPEGAVTRELAAPDMDVLWSHPRWSPDGQWIAVGRWREGGRWAIVLVKPNGNGEVIQVVESRAPLQGPAWSPDGRHLVWGWERSGGSNLFGAAFDPTDGSVGPLRQITDVVTAAVFPAIDPSGSDLVFSVLTASGWDLARVPFDPSTWFAPLPELERFTPVANGRGGAGGDGEAGEDADGRGRTPPQAAIGGEARPWSPAGSLLPRYWEPTWTSTETTAGVRVLPARLGATTSGVDAVGRNAWSASLAAPVGGPGRRWEGGLAWSWAGLGNPVLAADADQRWDPAGRALLDTDEGVGPPDTLYAVARERSAGLAAGFLLLRLRRSAGLTLGVRAVRQDRLLLERDGSESTRARLLHPQRDLAEASATVTLTNVRTYAFSVSPQEGASVALRVRERWHLALDDTLQGRAGIDGGRRDAVAVVRAFAPLPVGGFAPPVLALRAAGGIASGPGAGPGHFGVGGGGGGGGGVLGVTWDRAPGLFPVRGFPSGWLVGDRAWAAAGELRFPIAIVHRGVGVAPAYADRLVAGVFAEAAGARASTVPGSAGTIASAGAELGLFHLFFTRTPALLRLGVAVPIRGEGNVSAYGGLGWSF